MVFRKARMIASHNFRLLSEVWFSFLEQFIGYGFQCVKKMYSVFTNKIFLEYDVGLHIKGYYCITDGPELFYSLCETIFAWRRCTMNFNDETLEICINYERMTKQFWQILKS